MDLEDICVHHDIEKKLCFINVCWVLYQCKPSLGVFQCFMIA